MAKSSTRFEIHVHGDIPLQTDVQSEQVQEALRPLWQYAGASSLKEAAASSFDAEPGISHDRKESVLHICWTISGGEDFRYALDELCLGLNDIASEGAALEVSFYDADFDEEDAHESENEAQDDFVVLFVGPTPADIMQIQRNILVEHITAIMEQHFEPEQLGGVVEEIDKLFHQRFDKLVNSLQLGKPPRGAGPSGRSGSGRKPRHQH